MLFEFSFTCTGFKKMEVVGIAEKCVEVPQSTKSAGWINPAAWRSNGIGANRVVIAKCPRTIRAALLHYVMVGIYHLAHGLSTGNRKTKT